MMKMAAMPCVFDVDCNGDTLWTVLPVMWSYVLWFMGKKAATKYSMQFPFFFLVKFRFINLVISCSNDSITLDNWLGNEATEKKSVIKGKCEQNNEEEQTEKFEQQFDRQDLVAVEKGHQIYLYRKKRAVGREHACAFSKKKPISR